MALACMTYAQNPGKVAAIQTQGTALDVSSHASHKMDALDSNLENGQK